MKIIVPMAGRGKRMRPHTLTIPKPLLPIAGQPIVERLVRGISEMSDDPITDIAFVIGDFGKEVETQLHHIAKDLGAKCHICYQDQPLGTAHAILCAKEVMDDHLIIAFADTLFYADFKLDTEADGTIWVQKVDDPKAFGVVKVKDDVITDFVEKPQTFVSDLAIIGIYYVKDGAMLRDELQHLIDNDIRDKGEYQLTNALEHMKEKGIRFTPGEVREWLDCGNKDATVYTNQRVLELSTDSATIHPDTARTHAEIIEPCFIDKDVKLENCVVGPHVSIGKGTVIRNAIIKNAIIQEQAVIENALVENAMIGSHTRWRGKFNDLSLGDYSTFKYAD